MDFRLLGPLEIREGDQVIPVGGAKQRALLVILLLHANEVVSRERLIEDLWPGREPGAADHSLDHLVSRLRKTLARPDLLATRPGGYVLTVERNDIDVRRFEALVAEGRRANAEGRPSEAAAVLVDALALWRGGPLADVAYESFARGEVERLEELRLESIEERIEAELALGNHAALVGELELLTMRHPLRERFVAQRMLALYRSGRQAEALDVFAAVRRRLVDELGLEPGRSLQVLQRRILEQDPALAVPQAAPRRQSRRRRAVAGVGLTAVVAAGAIVVLHGGTQASSAGALARPDSVALVSADTGKLLAAAAVRAPVLTAYGEGALWTVAFDGELTKIDPENGEVLAFTNLPVVHPGGLAVGAGSVWVSDCCSPTLVRIDPDQTVEAQRIRLPTAGVIPGSETHEVVVGGGSVWVGRGEANPSWVERIDPRTGRVQHRIRIESGGAQTLAFGDGALWVGGSFLGYVSRVDAQTNKLTSIVRNLHGWLCCVAYGGGSLWAAIVPDQTVWKIGKDGTLGTSFKLPANIESLSYADGGVWAAVGDSGTVIRIDATTGRSRRYRLGHHLFGAVVRDGVVAVGVQRGGADVTAGLTGRVATVSLRLDWLSSVDPAMANTAFDPQQVQYHYATCAKLFNYPDAAGDPGRTLVPEVAAAWPTVTDAGRTYRFVIRPGFGFSPPSREAVTAESFRHAIERALSPTIPGPWRLAILPDVVGAAAYHAGRASHISGLSVEGNTLVIRLLRPAADLPTRLALPLFCAVPAKLPVVANGLDGPIPSAGPYYLADRAYNVWLLKRNPNYHGRRPRRLDAIVYRTGVATADAISLMTQSKVDYVAEQNLADLAADTPAARRSDASYRQTPNDWVELLALNARRPLFADPRLRRAVEYAIDRRALSAGYALATSHVLTPNFLGFRGWSGYPVSPDLAAARKLVAGRRARAVLATFDPAADPDSRRFAEAVRDQLAAIGITVTILPLTREDYEDPARLAAKLARADIVNVQKNSADTVDPARYLSSLPYLPPAARRSLGRIAQLRSPARELAVAALAAKLERDGLYVAYAHNLMPQLVSKRLGCQIDHPAYPGLDLAALCLRSRRR